MVLFSVMTLGFGTMAAGMVRAEVRERLFLRRGVRTPEPAVVLEVERRGTLVRFHTVEGQEVVTRLPVNLWDAALHTDGWENTVRPLFSSALALLGEFREWASSGDLSRPARPRPGWTPPPPAVPGARIPLSYDPADPYRARPARRPHLVFWLIDAAFITALVVFGIVGLAWTGMDVLPPKGP